MRRSTENGFVLISAMWLLILGAAIAALLMLRSINVARAVRVSSDGIAAAHLPDDAIATIAADILFRGGASSWSRLDAPQMLRLGERNILVMLHREATVADVNKTDLGGIDGSLHDHGYAPDQRAAILARVSDARATHHVIGSFAGVAALAAGLVPAGRETCLAAILSPFGGTNAAPLPGNLSNSGDGGAIHGGEVLRLALDNAGHHSVYVLRITASSDEPTALLDYYDDTCSDGVAATPGRAA